MSMWRVCARGYERMISHVVMVVILAVFFSAMKWALFAFVRPVLFYSDDVRHLYIIDRIRENKHRIPPPTDRFLVSAEPNYYPTFFHKICSYLPERFVKRYALCFTPAVEIATALTIYGIAAFLFFLLKFPNHQVVLLSAAVACVWFSTPMLYHHYRAVWIFTEKHLAELTAIVTLFSFFLFFMYGNSVFLIAGYLFFAMTAMSGQFPIQAFLFCALPFFSYVFGWKSLFFVAGVPVTIAITKGYYARVLINHVRIVLFRFRRMHTKYGFTWSLSETFKVPIYLLKRRKEDFFRVVLINPVFIVLFQIPFNVFVLYMLAQGNVTGNPIILALSAWWIISLIVSVVFIIVPALKVIGEPQRYLDFSLPVLCFLTIYLFFEGQAPLKNSVFWVCAGLQLAIWGVLVGMGKYSYDKLRRSHDDLDELNVFVARFKDPKTFLAIPGTLLTNILYNDPRHSAVHHILYWDIRKDERVYPKKYAIPDTDLKSIAEEFGANMLVVDKSAQEKVAKKYDIHYDLEGTEKIFENKRFAIYALPSK